MKRTARNGQVVQVGVGRPRLITLGSLSDAWTGWATRTLGRQTRTTGDNP